LGVDPPRIRAGKSTTVASMARPVSKLSEFILSLPQSMTATQVVQQAAAVGFNTSPNNVYRVRRLRSDGVNAERPVARTPRPPMPAAASTSPLVSAIEKLAEDFARSFIHAIRVSLIQVLDEAVAPSRPSRGRRPGGPTGRAPGRPHGSRTGAVAQRVEAVVSAIQGSPGIGAIEIRERTGLQQQEIVRPISLALRAGRITKKGDRRGTVYFAAT
jgi:hypothetical protein